MANVSEQPVFHVTPDVNNYGYRVVITGKLNPEAETYFRLKSNESEIRAVLGKCISTIPVSVI
jgi:hypothetical protein